MRRFGLFFALLACVLACGCSSSEDTAKIEKLEKEVAELRSEITTLRSEAAANAPTDLSALAPETKDNLEAEREFNVDDTTTSDDEEDEPIAKQMVVGSRNSDKYHYPGCRAANRINDSNLVTYDSPSEAASAGRIPCRICGP